MNSNLRTVSNDNSHSLLTAIHRFVQAVDTMDDTVMIPCRLRDIPIGSVNVCEENNNKAVVPAVPLSGDLYHFYSMLQAIRKEIVAGPPSSASAEEEDTDSLGSETDSSDDNGNNNENETAKKTASAFRYHLRGLFGLLHQMTETAKHLSTRYESEVSPSQAGISSVSSFNM